MKLKIGEFLDFTETPFDIGTGLTQGAKDDDLLRTPARATAIEIDAFLKGY